jgi:hypothetical protein
LCERPARHDAAGRGELHLEVDSLCRITIHYEMHIHPMWGIDRFVDANNDGDAGSDP